MRTLWFVQVTQYKLSSIGNLSAQQLLHTAADESEVRGYIYRLLEPLSYLAPDLGLGKFARAHEITHHTWSTLWKCATSNIIGV